MKSFAVKILFRVLKSVTRLDTSKPNKLIYKPRMMEPEEYPHLRMGNLQYQNQIHRVYHRQVMQSRDSCVQREQALGLRYRLQET